MVQRLGLCASNAGSRVWSLVGELKIPRVAQKKEKRRKKKKKIKQEKESNAKEEARGCMHSILQHLFLQLSGPGI